MTINEFTTKVDGMINDYQTGIDDDKEFRENIINLLIEISKPKLKAQNEAIMPRNYINSRVNKFSESMKEKLERNSFKGDWLDESTGELLEGLNAEITELHEAIFDPRKSKEDVKDECIDVANFAMFLHQKMDGKK